jgi:hypothetical protein
MANTCTHDSLTSTFERGVYCCACKEPLVGFFWPVSRNTPAGALLWALYNPEKAVALAAQKDTTHD